MINQISAQKINGDSPFKEFNSARRGYYLATPSSAAELPEDTVESEEKKAVDEKSKKLGLKITGIALGVGFGLLALTRGLFPKGTTRFLDKIKLGIENKLAKIKLDGANNKLEEFYLFSLQKVNSFAERAMSINNFVSIKDVAVKDVMAKTKGTKKIHQKITDLFDKISYGTVKGAYSKTTNRFSKLSNYLDKVDSGLAKYADGEVGINGKKMTISKWIEARRAGFANVRKNFDTDFGLAARESREKFIKDSVDGLEDVVREKGLKNYKKNFRSKEMYQSFIADNAITPQKMEHANVLSKAKQGITNNVMDSYKATKEALFSIQTTINPKDKVSADIIKTLKNNLDAYIKLSGPSENVARNKLNQEIMDNLNKLAKNIQVSAPEFQYSAKAVEQISKHIKDMNNIISKSSKGELQEILTIYKGLLDRKEYQKLKKQVDKAIASLDKTISTEKLYFEKVRDLQNGSAVTDVISLLGSLGVIGVGLTKADNNEERKTVALKYGVPIIGTLSTMLYFSTKLVPAGKAMIYGAISGLVFSKIGLEANNLRKKYEPKAQETINNITGQIIPPKTKTDVVV